MTACASRWQVDRHFSGAISPGEERTMRDHLGGCEGCRAYYGRHLLLARIDPIALPAEERIARGLGLRWRPASLLIPVSFAAVLAAAAAFLLFVRVGASTSGFWARGHAAVEARPTSKLFVYDIRAGNVTVPAIDSIGKGDELAFAYENGAAKRRLMVFGVDEHRHVYWFFPAWDDQADDPVAVPIQADGRRHELLEAIRHPLDGHRLEIHALFVDEPLSVKQVETLLEAHPSGPLPIGGAVETSTALVVMP